MTRAGMATSRTSGSSAVSASSDHWFAPGPAPGTSGTPRPSGLPSRAGRPPTRRSSARTGCAARRRRCGRSRCSSAWACSHRTRPPRPHGDNSSTSSSAIRSRGSDRRSAMPSRSATTTRSRKRPSSSPRPACSPTTSTGTGCSAKPAGRSAMHSATSSIPTEAMPSTPPPTSGWPSTPCSSWTWWVGRPGSSRLEKSTLRSPAATAS